MTQPTVASGSALLMLLSGIGLSVAGFVADPFGEISDSVLWYVSQSLVYAGSIFGVTVYVRTKMAEISNLVKDATLQRDSFKN